jgi:hypothetical protein
VNLWLDDIRDPADFGCDGFNWVKTVGDAKVLLLTGQVEQASLDHDLGACDECMGGKTAEEWLVETDFTAMPNCTHVGSWL